ncbi:hypothetical protein [Streptomyces sp. NPDC060184]|uniref:hypothetical protein n=1 Tax=Streptomyces sp. NPDC060184 TaxID=3347064 RepID=UPI00364BFC49
MSTDFSDDTTAWPVPTTPAGHDPALLALAMRDMRLTWRARGVLAELTLGYLPGQKPTISDLLSLTRDERGPVAEGRGALHTAVTELRTLGYLTIETTTSKIGERLVVDLAPAPYAHLIPTSVPR